MQERYRRELRILSQNNPSGKLKGQKTFYKEKVNSSTDGWCQL